MNKSIIVYKSITVANRAKKIMEKEGIEAYVIQLPSDFNIRGCNYALSVNYEDLTRAIEVSEKYKLKMRAYFEDIDKKEELEGR